MKISISKYYYLYVPEIFFKKYPLHIYGRKNLVPYNLISGIQVHISRDLLFILITTMCGMTYLL